MLLSTALDAVYEKVQDLGQRKTWFIYPVSLFLIITLINGLGIIPEMAYQRVSENPFVTRTDIHFNNYFQETLLLPLVAYFLRLTSLPKFNLLCYVIIALGYAIFTHYTYRRWGAFLALAFSTLLITGPLTTILFTWLGIPDGLTMALLIPLLFTNSAFPIFLLATLGAMNHVVFLIAAIEIIALRWVSRDGLRFYHIASIIAGGFTGIFLVKAFLTFNQIEVASRLDFIFTKSIWDWAKLNAAHFPLSLFSLFNVQWLAIIICFSMFFKWDKRFYVSVSGILFFNYVVTFFSLDTTRIFAILSMGIFMICLFHSYKLALHHPLSSTAHQKQFLQALILIGIISIIAPRYFSWVGEIHATPFYEFMRQLI